MPEIPFNIWGVIAVAAVILIPAIGSFVFGLLNFLDRRRQQERQRDAASLMPHDQPLHERYVSRTTFDGHVANTDERFKAATAARKDIHKELDAHGARIAVLESTDAHHSRLLHSIDDKLTRLTENLLRDKK